MSSYNDEDYEVDENSDDEEQEDPNDYCKGDWNLYDFINILERASSK